MKIKLKQFLIEYWGIKFFDEGIRIWCPLFLFEMGWIKNLYFDVIECKIGFHFYNNWPLDTGSFVFKKDFEKIYDRISLIMIHVHELPWHYFQKKYIRKLYSRYGTFEILMITKG